MGLAPATRLGPYEILAPLGVGGMGEVYRARDTRLERTVAIKILPSHLSSDPVHKQRFEREAKTVSSLNHPHICTLHDIGSQDGVAYLVMECLEGETLAKRLEKGPLPLEQVLKLGAQIANALDKAHQAGIVHRDLKPGNIMLTATGAKLLDFGLAKPAAAVTEMTLTGATQTTPVTQEGTIVGTFQYMSPEQIEGKELDGRSDIFSLGAVLYEMLTGQKAFQGKSQLSVASAILEKEPAPVSSIKPLTPLGLDYSIKKCLAKQPDARWQSASDLGSQLQWISEGGSQADAPGVSRAGPSRRELVLLTGGALLLAVCIVTLPFAVSHWRDNSSPSPTIRFAVHPPEKQPFESDIAVSPDGRSLAFVTSASDTMRIWIRPLDAVEAHPLAGTENGHLPFWSPDGRYLAFFADAKLKKIEIATGTVETLCDALDPRGGTWSRTGVILFAPKFNVGLFEVSAEGGEPKPISTVNYKSGELSHRWPHFLPDGRHYIYFSYHQTLLRKPIMVASLDSREQKQILESASMVQYAGPGYLVYVRERTLVAQRFDSTKLQVEGNALPLAEGVEAEGEVGFATGLSAFSVGESGVLAYRTGTDVTSQLTWYDRRGSIIGKVGGLGTQSEPSISPDGKSIAVSRQNSGGPRSIWIYDIARDTQTRLTFESGADDGTPVWTADGKKIVFASTRGGASDLYWKASNGVSQEEMLYTSEHNKLPDDVSRDGRYLIFEQDNPQRGHYELWILPLTGDRKPWPYLQTGFDVNRAVFSPDGRWVAYAATYQSTESVRSEIFVQSFPETGAQFQISNGGGDLPVWRRDGKEILYVTPDSKIMSVPIEAGSAFKAGIPQTMFQMSLRDFTTAGSRTQLGIAVEGQKILVNARKDESAKTPIIIVANWNAELKK